MPCSKFLSEHEQKNLHLCHIKDTQHVPVILSPALPCPDRDEEEYERWCRSIVMKRAKIIDNDTSVAIVFI